MTSSKTALRRQNTIISIILLIWFSLVLAFSLNQGFIPTQGEPPQNILISGAISMGLFFLAYLAIPAFRYYVLNIDMRLLIMLHSWRMLGLGFVMLYMVDALPPLFAFLAGLGDAATAIAAIFLAYIIFTNKKGVTKKTIWRWNTFGLLDFIIAVSVGMLTQTDAPLFAENGVSSDLVNAYPLVLIPAFVVQLLAITHIIIYLQLHNNHNTDNLIFIK